MTYDQTPFNISIRLDHKDNFISFKFPHITSGEKINDCAPLSEYFKGCSLEDILSIDFSAVANALKIVQEKDQFVLFSQWSALRAAIAQYLGNDEDQYDKDRCKIISIEHHNEGIEIAEVIYPPKEMPKVLPCAVT